MLFLFSYLPTLCFYLGTFASFTLSTSFSYILVHFLIICFSLLFIFIFRLILKIMPLEHYSHCLFLFPFYNGDSCLFFGLTYVCLGFFPLLLWILQQNRWLLLVSLNSSQCCLLLHDSLYFLAPGQYLNGWQLEWE